MAKVRKNKLEGERALVAFEVERGFLCIINKEGGRVPLLSADRLNTQGRDFSDSVRLAISQRMGC